MIKLKKVRHTAKVDISPWDFDLLETMFSGQLMLKILKVISKDIQFAIENHASIFFPIEFFSTDGVRGKPVNDPDIMYLGLPLGEYEDEQVYWSFRLSDAIEDMLDLHTTTSAKKYTIEPEDAQRFIAMRDHLRALADKIDKAVERGKSDLSQKKIEEGEL